MIENKDFKLAQDENERFWTEIKESTEADIKKLNQMLKFQKAVLRMCKGKLNKYEKKV